MAVPTQPTKISIVEEALRASGSLTDYRRANSEWFEELKRDIATRKKWTILEATAVLNLTVNDDILSLPSDFDSHIKVVHYYGDNVGTTQSIVSSTVTLAAGEDISQEDAEGEYLFLYSSLGTNEYGQITSYNTTTKEAVVNFTPATGGTITYLIPDNNSELTYQPWEEFTRPRKPGQPRYFSIYDDQIRLDRGTDTASEAVLLDYHVDVSLLNETDAKATIIYREWRMALIHGIRHRAYVEAGDERQSLEFSAYENSVERAQRDDGSNRRARRGIRMRSIGGMPMRRKF